MTGPIGSLSNRRLDNPTVPIADPRVLAVVATPKDPGKGVDDGPVLEEARCLADPAVLGGTAGAHTGRAHSRASGSPHDHAVALAQVWGCGVLGRCTYPRCYASSASADAGI